MTPTQKLHKLLSAALNHDNFQLDTKVWSQEYSQIGLLLVALGWLTQDYAQAYQCSQCGQMHKIEVFKGKYYIGCDSDDQSGLEQLDKDELLIYRFSLPHFVEWINQQLGLGESPQKLSEQTWYLGEMTTPGKKHTIFFTQDIADAPKTKDQIMLTMGSNKHEGNHDTVNLSAYLSVIDQLVIFDAEKLKKQFSSQQPVVGLTVTIGQQIKLTQSEDKSTNQLHFDLSDNGEYQHVLPITPQMFNIVYHLDHLRNSTNSHKSSADMKKDGLAENARSITTRIGELNKLFTSQSWEKMILRDSGNRYYINPDYYA
ncbi:MAG: hypothetical protein COU68_00655 [Candidatus Pacebacteria bacterium CG10_big_fil_rev_8_21_14_0_10_45_6]|nr:MAG: hypothetical protein COU68_00655 [Candidatus Pacebacteria bacterium CG10_big_fil_rev_8_21_14_0_10_45_6]